jgi:hypothetical protein
LLEWSNNQGKTTHTKYVPLSSANTGIVSSYTGFKRFCAYASFFSAFNVSYVTNDETSDSEDEKEQSKSDMPESKGASEPSFKQHQAEIKETFPHTSATKVNVIPQEEEKPLLPSDEQLFMEYHEKLGHLSFDQLIILAQQGLIPKKLAQCRIPKCPGCLYGKAHRKPWRTKAQPKKVKVATKPGEIVSVDQMQSTTPGLVPQAKGKLTSKCYRYATVFADHYSDLTYVHLQENITSEETVQAKQSFERYARAHGVEIKHYHCDNG